MLKRLKSHYYLTYSLVFAFVSCLAFFFFAINGRTFIAGADGFNQYYPTYYYIGKYIRNSVKAILCGNRIQTYDLTIGFGGDIISTLNYYGFGDVFNITSVFFSGKYSVIGYSITVLLKLYISGISFSKYAFHSGCTKHASLSATFLFIFSGFSLSFGLLFPSFLTALVYLPWMIWGLDDLFNEWRYSGKLILAVALQSMVSFYFLYMDAVFCLLYVILHIICDSQNGDTSSIRHSIKICVKIVFQVIIGIMISGIFLMPTLYEYLHSARTDESSIIKYLGQYYSTSEWLERGAGILTGPGFGMGLGLSLIGISSISIGIKRLLNYRKYRKVDAYPGEIPLSILLVILIVGYCIPFFGSIMNGFSYSTDRWTYLLVFSVAVSLARYMPEFADNIHLIEITDICAGIICVICVICENKLDKSVIIRAGWIALDLILIFIIYKPIGSINLNNRHAIQTHIANNQMHILCVMSILEIAMMAALNNAPHIIGGDGYYTLFKNIYAYQEVTDSAFANTSKALSSENTFVRTDLYDTSYGASLITGTQGTTSYFSIQNSNLQRFMNAYEISGGIQGGSFCFQGLEGRTSVEALLSATNGAENTQDFIPFGTFFDHWSTEQDADQANPLTRNAYLLSTVVLDLTEDEAQKIAETTRRVRNWDDPSTEVQYENAYCNIEIQEDNMTVEKGGVITLALKESVSADDEYYVLFHDFRYKGNDTLEDIYVNGKRIRLRPKASFSGQTGEFMIMIDPTEDFLQNGRINIEFQGNGEFSLRGIEIRKHDLLTDHSRIENQKQHILRNVEIGENYISGYSNEGKNGILFVSIPYSNGWKCYIDGTETNIIRADYGFSAAQVPHGIHHIEWKYDTPYLRNGIIITIAGIILALLLISNLKFTSKVINSDNNKS